MGVAGKVIVVCGKRLALNGVGDYIMAHDINKHLEGIGRVAAILAHLDFYVNEIIWELANLDRSAGACLTAQLTGPYPRCKALVALMRFRAANQPLIDTANSLTSRYCGLGDRRNRVVHDAWTNSWGDAVQRVHIKADRKLEFEFREDTVEDLNDS